MLQQSPEQALWSGVQGMLLVLLPAVDLLLISHLGSSVPPAGLEPGQPLHLGAEFGLFPFLPVSGTTVLLEQQHSKGWECSGELQGGTVAVDLLIKINVLADKDDSVPIAVRARILQGRSSTFLPPQQLQPLQPELWGTKGDLHSSPGSPGPLGSPALLVEFLRT